MKILVVNDDSIHALGIELLAKAAMELGEVYVVAPAEQCSAMSQKLTIRGTLEVKRVDFPVPVKEAYSVSGTPADCIKVALYYIMKEKPDFVFSGINDGYNAGYDIAYSGTLGAAFEARMNGIPAIAFSSAGRKPMTVAEQHLVQVARELMAAPLGEGEVWNVNFPADTCRGILRQRTVAHIPMYNEKYTVVEETEGRVLLESCGYPLPKDAAVPEGTDVEALRMGYISIGTVKNAVL